MANENNATVIVLKMMEFFKKTKVTDIRIELGARITNLANRFAPSPIWFAKTIQQLFIMGTDLIIPEVAFSVIDEIEKECDEERQRIIIDLYIDVAQSGARLTDLFVSVIARIFGQLGFLSEEYDLDFVALLLCDLADFYPRSRDWVIRALISVCARLEVIPQQVINIFESYKKSKNYLVQELSYEGLALMNRRGILRKTIEPSSELDEELSFLNEFVDDAVKNKNFPCTLR